MFVFLMFAIIMCFVVGMLLFLWVYYAHSLQPLYEGDWDKTNRFMSTIVRDRMLPFGSLEKIRKSIDPTYRTLPPDHLRQYFTEFESQRVSYDYLQWM